MWTEASWLQGRSVWGTRRRPLGESALLFLFGHAKEQRVVDGGGAKPYSESCQPLDSDSRL